MRCAKTLRFLVATVVFLLGWVVGVRALYGYNGPYQKIFDWCSSPEYYGTAFSPNMDTFGFQSIQTKYTPSPMTGEYVSWNDPGTLHIYDRLMSENRPVSFRLTNDTSPLTGYSTFVLPSTLSYLSSQHYRLDYVWPDFEFADQTTTDANVAEVVRQVRASTDPNINQARIGEYDSFKCSNRAWSAYPNQNTQASIDAQNNSYNSTGVNVAMPSCYPYEYYEMHATSTWPSNNRSPNVRSALFWAPLEKFSNAKINLPSGHEIIPWISNFVPWDGYSAAPPPRVDDVAMLQHMRLRGAEGYYLFETAVASDMEQYRGDMYAAWSSLDWLFAGVDKANVKVLNLATNKTVGFEWSAVETPRGVAVLASDLSGGEYGHYMESSWLVAAGMDPDYVEKLYPVYGNQYIPVNTHVMNVYMNPVPEPATMTLLLSGAVVWLLRRRTMSGPMPLS